jgi:predicted trehalose synthase
VADSDPTAVAITNFANAISERVVNRSCPACNSEDWSFPTDRAMGVQWVHNVDGRVTLTGSVHLAIGFVCLTCGYVRMHIPPADL